MLCFFLCKYKNGFEIYLYIYMDKKGDWPNKSQCLEPFDELPER